MVHSARRQQVLGGRVAKHMLGGVALVLVASGCSGGTDEGSSPIELAQAQVAAMEHALAESKSDFQVATAAFCDATKTYITSLDRYGDVLTARAPTVGDVKDAGTDLVQPRGDATSGAETAVAAQQAVLDAKQELAVAEAALVAASATGSASPSEPDDSKSAKPLVPPATVKMVEDAESQFTSAQQG